MNTKQQTVIGCGLSVVIAMTAYPPWATWCIPVDDRDVHVQYGWLFGRLTFPDCAEKLPWAWELATDRLPAPPSTTSAPIPASTSPSPEPDSTARPSNPSAPTRWGSPFPLPTSSPPTSPFPAIAPAASSPPPLAPATSASSPRNPKPSAPSSPDRKSTRLN